MSGITNPAEEYFKDGLWGWVTNAWKKLVATAGGALHVQFAGQEADVEVKQATPADLTPGICGWDGNSWQKLPILWGYSSIYGEEIEDPDTASGTEVLDGTEVLAGEVWIVEAVIARNKTTDPSSITLQANINGQFIVCKVESAPGIAGWVIWNGRITLAHTDYITASFAGGAIDDHIELRISGYKMKIAE